MKRKKILSVDDDSLNRQILTEYLTEGGYEVIEADDGDTALTLLDRVSGIDAVVVDRIMPRLSGMEVLRAVKTNPRFADIPVIMQSAASAREQILEGIKAGVYYYLTKPYDDRMLLAIVGAALSDSASQKRIREEVYQQRRVLGLMEQSRFRFRTLEEARNLALLLAHCFPDPEGAVYGLNEMLTNAVEHGNLGITYGEKTRLVMAGRLFEEIDLRLSEPDNESKWAYLSYEASTTEIKVRIKDHGAGFDWRKYLEISPDRATHPHGRGIATARMLSFTSLEYLGCGNEVVCTVATSDHGSTVASTGAIGGRRENPASANS